MNGSFGLSALLRPHVLLLIAIVLVVIVVLAVGISSCVKRNNELASQAMEEAKPKNEQDERVAAGVSASMTSKFTEAFDYADLLESIAQNADQYDDERLLTLALTEPTSAKFVASYPSSDKSSRPYDSMVTRGEVPQLFDWDERWGAVTYGDGPLAITGSGPATLAMAYMGLTGKTDFSPTEIAQQASKSNFADGDSGTKGEMFYKLPTTMGLESSNADISADTLLTTLGENTVFAVELKESTLTDDAHWALVVNVNEDGSVTVYDPTSTTVSSRPWDAGTVADASTAFYSISITEKAIEELEKGGTGTGTSSSSSSTSSSTSSDADADADANADEETDTGKTTTTSRGTASSTTDSEEDA